jgi:hypothetical protein
MSTELFRKYIDILKEASEEVISATIADITRLKSALIELETVLANYEGRIHEDQQARNQNRLLEVLSPEELEALRQAANPSPPPSGPSRMSKLLSSPAVQDAMAIGKTSLRKNARSLRKGAFQGAAAAAAWTALTELYDWITSKKLDSLRPGDQEIIKKNIPIIQPWTAPDKLKTLDPDLRFRLLHVVELLEKLGMSLGAQSPVQNEEVDSEQPEAPEPQVDQELLNLLDKAYAQINESNHTAIKRFVLQNMHLLSEAEQMAVRRNMLSEIDIPDWVNPSTWPVWAQAAGGLGAAKYGPGAVSGAYNAVTDKLTKQARIEAEIEAAKKAAETTATQTAAAIDAANQENARITAQNAEAERQWRTKSPATRGPRPTPKPLVPVPEMPLTLKSPRRGPIDRSAAAIGRTGMKYPKISKLIAAAVGLGSMGAFLYGAVKGTEKTVTTAVDAANTVVQSKATEVENQLDLFKRAAQMTDEQLAGTLLQTPENYLKFANVVMDYCSGHPGTPKCQERMTLLCKDPVLKDLNGGPLDGC